MAGPGFLEQTSAPEPCPTEAAILGYVEGLAGEGDARVEAHVETCDECRKLVSLLVGESRSPDAVGEGAALRPGDVIAGKYEILSEIGRGGMGIVVKAFHRRLGQPVALKFLLGALSRDAAATARFFREARAAAALGSPHVVRVLDADRLPSGEPFLALEYLEGRDLGAELRARGPLPIAEAVSFVLDACEALALAHRHGIVHRDIKPSNLFATVGVDGTPMVKVLDFGVAKMRRGGDGSVDRTDPASIVGSPRYMPPEQLQRADVDARADVWALAVSLFELLTGRAPFEGTTLIEICAAIALSPPTKLGTLRPDAPPALAAALERALTKDREKRTPSIEAFAEAITPRASAAGAARLARIRRITTTGSVPVAIEASAVPRRRTGIRLAAIAAVGVALAAAFAAWIAARAAPSDRSEPLAASAAARADEPAPLTIFASSALTIASPVPSSLPPGPSSTSPPVRRADELRSSKRSATAAPLRAAEDPPPMSSSPLHRDGLVDRK
jgi:eukaryotic-like serine/threonine-protein kinase